MMRMRTLICTVFRLLFPFVFFSVSCVSVLLFFCRRRPTRVRFVSPMRSTVLSWIAAIWWCVTRVLRHSRRRKLLVPSVKGKLGGNSKFSKRERERESSRPTGHLLHPRSHSLSRFQAPFSARRAGPSPFHADSARHCFRLRLFGISISFSLDAFRLCFTSTRVSPSSAAQPDAEGGKALRNDL